MSSRRPSRQAFTLVELLVVIGIIAMLISILMPALSAARAQANTIKCAANLRAIGQTMHLYAGDHKGMIPRDYNHGIQYPDGQILYAEAFARYLNKSFKDNTNGSIQADRDLALRPEFRKIGVYQCPVFPNDEQDLDYVANGFPIRRGTSSRAEPMINITKIKQGSTFAYLTDGNVNLSVTQYSHHDVWQPDQLAIYPPGSGKVSDRARMITDNRHRGLANILAVDGSVMGKQWRGITEKDFRMVGM